MSATRIRERPKRGQKPEESLSRFTRVLKRLEIERFRGVRNLVLDELAPVTILTGRNGCGKTTVLEAVFLLCGLSNATLVFSLAAFRGVPAIAGADTAFRVLLPDLLEGGTASLAGESEARDGNGRLALEIVGITAPMRAGPSTEPQAQLVGLEFRARSRSGERKGSVRWEPAPVGPGAPVLEFGPMRFEGVPGIRTETPDNPDRLSARYVRPQPHAVMPELHTLLTGILQRRAMRRVLDLVSLIAPNVTEIHPLVEVGQPAIYVNTGAERLFPAQILGGGFINLLQLATFMCDDASQLLLIDELEDGLHYTVVPALAEAVVVFAKERQKQFLIATHSRDVVAAFGQAAGQDPELVTFFKLYRHGDSTMAARFSVEDWQKLDEIGGEIR